MSASITAVIPTKDRAGLLTTTLRSILAQREVDLEVVIVDDGSDPAQAEHVAALAGGPVRVLRNERPRGVAAARNQGIHAARTPWVAVCDDDDLWVPTKLARQLEAAEAAGAAWAYTGAVKFEVGPVVWQVMPPPTGEELVRRLPHKCIVPAGASNVLADRATVLEVGGFDTGLMHMADWDLWLRLLDVGLPGIAPGIGVGYRLHPVTMSLRPEGILAELAVIDRRWQHLRGGEPLDVGPTHLSLAMAYLRAGRRRAAAAAYLRAARSRPRQGLRGVARTLYPVAPSPAERVVGAEGRRPALKRVAEVTLPDDTHRLLRDLAGEAAARDAERAS